MGQIDQRIRAARAYGRLSQIALAELLEVAPNTFKRIELGTRPPKRSELLAIAEACGVPMWFLVGGWEGWRSTAQGEVEARSIAEASRGALADLHRRGDDPIQRQRRRGKGADA